MHTKAASSDGNCTPLADITRLPRRTDVANPGTLGHRGWRRSAFRHREKEREERKRERKRERRKREDTKAEYETRQSDNKVCTKSAKR